MPQSNAIAYPSSFTLKWLILFPAQKTGEAPCTLSTKVKHEVVASHQEVAIEKNDSPLVLIPTATLMLKINSMKLAEWGRDGLD